MILDTQDAATILAALRYYQAAGMGDPAMRSDDIHDIATDGGNVISMDAAGIDDLCDRINTTDPLRDAAPDMLAALKSTERMLKHYVGEPPESDPVDAARRPVLHAAWESIKRARTAIAKAEGPPMADFSPAELFNCWVGGISPTPEEVSLWDALKVQGVRNVSETDDETRFEACDDCDAEMWSVYGHYRPSPQHAGCELITDGPAGNQAAAIAIAEHLGRLWGLPVRA